MTTSAKCFSLVIKTAQTRNMFPFLLIESSAPAACQGYGRMAATTAIIIIIRPRRLYSPRGVAVVLMHLQSRRLVGMRKRCR